MPPLGIEFSARFKAGARALPEKPRRRVAQAVDQLGEAFGQPHLHSGLGIRRLKGAIFEFRAGQDVRVVFKLEGSTASLLFVGDHDAVRVFLKNR